MVNFNHKHNKHNKADTMSNYPGQIILKDALFNLDERAGTPAEYNHGLVVGMTAGLMAGGMSYPAALLTITRNLPARIRPDCLPPVARADIMAEVWANWSA